MTEKVRHDNESPAWARYLSHAHLLVTACLAIALVPSFHALHLPLEFAWRDAVVLYWVRYTILSLFLAIALYALGQPRAFFQAIVETGPKVPFPINSILAMVIPAVYFFWVFFFVVFYNHLIAALLFNGSGDKLLAKVDLLLLRGHSVSQFAHFAITHLNTGWVNLTESVYFSMFVQIGSCIILLAVRSGLRESFKFVGALATAYYLALLLFAIIPATGPYYACSSHAAAWNSQDLVAQMQATVVRQLNQFREPAGHPGSLGVGYYIALPCMHLVQPLIILWFLRKWGFVFWILAVWDVAILASVVVLEQHYLVDILAAFPVALLAVAAVDWQQLKKSGAGDQAPAP